jgi:hypothetical protein
MRPAELAFLLKKRREDSEEELLGLAKKLYEALEKKKSKNAIFYELVADTAINAIKIGQKYHKLMEIAYKSYEKAIILGNHRAMVKMAFVNRELGEYEKAEELFQLSMKTRLENKIIDRASVIQRLLNVKENPTYLEIGVLKGDVFFQIKADRKVAVDPLNVIPGGFPKDKSSEFYKMLSNDFFIQRKDILPIGGFDVIFIDGLHTHQQSLDDALNSLNHLKEDGVIVMHDCIPRVHCGVGKTIAFLRTRKDLNIFVLRADAGLGIITKAPAEKVLNYTRKDISSMPSNYFISNCEELLNLKPAEYFEEFIGKRM